MVRLQTKGGIYEMVSCFNPALTPYQIPLLKYNEKVMHQQVQGS